MHICALHCRSFIFGMSMITKEFQMKKMIRDKSYKFTMNYPLWDVRMSLLSLTAIWGNCWRYFRRISISSFQRNCKADVKPSPTGYGLIGPLCTCREGEEKKKKKEKTLLRWGDGDEQKRERIAEGRLSVIISSKYWLKKIWSKKDSRITRWNKILCKTCTYKI